MHRIRIAAYTSHKQHSNEMISYSKQVVVNKGLTVYSHSDTGLTVYSHSDVIILYFTFGIKSWLYTKSLSNVDVTKNDNKTNLASN